MRDLFKVLLGFVMLLVVVWILAINNFAMFSFFAPKVVEVQRQTFEQSRSFNEGMAQEISNMQLEYVKASPEHKKALKSVILHRVAGYDTDLFSPYLRDFIDKLRSE